MKHEQKGTLDQFFLRNIGSPSSDDAEDFEGEKDEPSYRETDVWVLDKDLTLVPGGELLTTFKGRQIALRIPEKPYATRLRYRAGEILHVTVESSADKRFVLSGIMEYELYELLRSIGRRHSHSMNSYTLWECPEKMRAEILGRRSIVRAETEDRRPAEILSKYFILAYWMTRDSYTPAQRDRIEQLLPKESLLMRGKTEVQLDYILNVSEENRMCVVPDRAKAMKILDERIAGREKAKRRIADILSARGTSGVRGVKILLVGSEGSGRERFTDAIRRIVDLPYEEIELSGESNPCELSGFHATYSDADAGSILQTFRRTRTAESMIVWKNVDKTGSSREGVAINALKGIFCEDMHTDNFTRFPLSTRQTVHVLTANSTRSLPDFIVSSCEVIRLEPYTEDEKVQIARRFIIPELIKKLRMENLCKRQKPEVAALRFIARNFCGDDGMKQMEACCEQVLRNMRDRTAAGEKPVFDEKTVRAILGEEPDRNDPMIRFRLATGLYRKNIIDEIETTRERLRDEKLRESDRAIDELRLGYLVDMHSPEPNGSAFVRADFLKRLNETHYGMTQVKELLADHLTAQTKKDVLTGTRILLEGDPGIGKTSITASLASAIDAAYVRIPLNSIDQASTLKGLYRTYNAADAGLIVKRIAEAMRAKPHAHSIVLHLDEVDKLSPNLQEILIDLLDDSAEFLDQFLETPISLAHVMFVGTANDISRIPQVILDRFRVIHLNGYTETEKRRILRAYILPERERAYAAAGVRFCMDEEAESLLLSVYCRGSGVRDLKKAVERLTEFAVARRPEAAGTVELNADVVERVLGCAPSERGNLPAHWLPGCAKALSVSSGGAGNCFAVEAMALSGDPELVVTGLAGESTLESVKIAQTYLRSRFACAKGSRFIHISFGEGAVRKDGPSAGVAILIALLSAMRGECADPKAAYTGEIDLLGNVFAVGGVYQKLYAAQRAGCTRVFVPAENAARLTDEERASLSVEIVPVTHVDEVIPAVFDDADAGKGTERQIAHGV